MKKKLPNYEEWKKSTEVLPDLHIPRQCLDRNWKEKALAKRKFSVIHRECGHRVESTAKEGFCPQCGDWIVLHLESKGRRCKTPRAYYTTKSSGYYCPHCKKTTSFKFLMATKVENLEWLAWQCPCGTIHIHPLDADVTGSITLVGPKWTAADLTPWGKK